MSGKFSILWCVLGILLTVYGTPTGTKNPKKYVVNLDLAPEERWAKVAADNPQLIKDAHSIFS